MSNVQPLIVTSLVAARLDTSKDFGDVYKYILLDLSEAHIRITITQLSAVLSFHIL